MDSKRRVPAGGPFDLVRRFRQRHDWSQDELANILGVNIQTVARWEIERPSRGAILMLLGLHFLETYGDGLDEIKAYERLAAALQNGEKGADPEGSTP